MNFIIKRKVFISMLFIGVTMMGYFSWRNLSMELVPSAELPQLYVTISCRQDVDPKYMEDQVVVPLEGAIGTLPGIENVQSQAQSKRGTILVEFNKGINFKYTYLKLQEKVNEVKPKIPTDFTVSVQRVDQTQMNNQFMQLQVTGSGGVDRVRNIADLNIQPELQNIDGIAGVNVYGGAQKSIEVQLNMEICDAYKITPATIRNKISQNYKARTFAGYTYGSNLEYFVQVSSDFTDLKDLENIVIATGPILLKNVANVYFGTKEQTSYSRVNGKDAVSITLINDSQSNLIDLSHRTLAVIDKVNKTLAEKDVQIAVQNNSADTMEKNLHQIGELALVGALLAVFILWIFLKNIQLVSIITLAIPISIFTAFNFFYAAEISINSLTLVGMALAVGMLLDNSVVVLENIYRLRGTGKPPKEAVIQGTKEVWRSVVAATLVTVTVFLPFLFSDDPMIQLIGKNVGTAIVSTLSISLLVALFLVPMLAYTFLKSTEGGNLSFTVVSTRNKLVQAYVMILKYSLRKPAQTIIGVVIVFFIAIFTCLMLSNNSLRSVNTNAFRVSVTMPSGSTIDATDKLVAQIESRIDTIPEKQDITSNIQADAATVTFKVKDNYQKTSKRTIAQIRDDVTKLVTAVLGAQIDVNDASITTGGSSPAGGSGIGRSGTSNLLRYMGVGTNQERILIKGQDFEVMKNVASDLQFFLQNLESMNRVRVSISDNRPEVHLRFHPLLISENNTSLSNISNELNSFSVETNTSIPFMEGTEQYDIIIKEMPRRGQTLEELKKGRTIFNLKTLPITDTGGGLHELQTLSDIVYSSGYSNITRVNQEKQIEVSYSFISAAQDSKELLNSYREEIDKIVENYNLPAGVAIQVIHEEDTMQGFYFLILAAFIIIFMILAAVFESVTTPIVLMFSIPLAAIGSFVALILTNNSLFNTNTIIGFLILLGVVVNNGIILIDYTNILRKRGFHIDRALIMAGMSRIRPILITAIVTMVAMLPLAMGDNEYVGAIGAPFAITVIGGLSMSTLLTLVFIPTFYYGMNNAVAWLRSLPNQTKVIQLVLITIGLYFVFINVDDFLWKLIDTVIVAVGVPGATWFIMNSLRKAQETVIDPDQPIHITVQNLVKIYSWGSRFQREWIGNSNIRDRAGITKYYHRIKDFDDFLWQLPLFGYLIYFSFSYLNNGLFMFVLAHFIYFMALGLWEPITEYLTWKVLEKNKRKWFINVANTGRNIIYWGLPIIFLILFYFRWGTVWSVITIGLIWYFALTVKVTAEMLYRDKVNVERLKGRFAGTRRLFFKLVENFPVIGRKKDAFKALKGVSIEIKTGMIGLLGPNGAGKSTMMRIICGIYEQSYGKVWINGVDTQEKREELQGLIGYLPQEFGTYENMSAYEFLDYQAILKGLTNPLERHSRIEYVLSSVHLWDRKDDKIGGYSGGMKQRMGIAQILLHLPRILVVDEPTAGLDPRERIRFRNLLVELARERVVIFSTHIIEDISSSCNQVVVINHGQMCYAGNPSAMVHIAEGLVWQFYIPESEFDGFPAKDRVVHHMRDGENIKMRVLSQTKPREDAIQVRPVLEEAYLCLLKGIKRKE